MHSKTLIAMAVASACAWPAIAAATGDARESGHWAVVTPVSVNESGAWFEHQPMDAASSPPRALFAAGAPAAEPGAAVSVDESAPAIVAERALRPARTAPLASLPNPQVPWTANESGPVRYAEEMRTQVEHVAAVEDARIAAARTEEVMAIAPATADTPSAPTGELAAGPLPLERPANDRTPETTVGLVDSRHTAGTTALLPEAPPSDPAEGERLPESAAGLIDTRQSTLGTATLPTGEPGAAGLEPPTGAEPLSADVSPTHIETAQAAATPEAKVEGEAGFTPGTGLTRVEPPATEAPVTAPRADKPGPVDDTSVVRRDPDAVEFEREAASTPAETPGIGRPGHIPGHAEVTVHSGPGDAPAHPAPGR